MDYRKLVRVVVIFVAGVFLGKPAVEALDGAITVLQQGQATQVTSSSKDE